jgi:hypothetical protein
VPNDGSKKGSCSDYRTRALCTSKTQCDAIGAQTAAFLVATVQLLVVLAIKGSFYQDRLRTNIGKSQTKNTVCAGVAWSPDGVTWTANATTLLRVQTVGHPCGQIRTPLGLVAEPERCVGCYSVLWTGYSHLKGTDHSGYTPVCHALVKQTNENGPPL